MVGPVNDNELLDLIARGEIDRDSFVQSPQLTRNQEVRVSQINLSALREMCSQRAAEDQRVHAAATRKSQRDKKNYETLLQGIKKAIADGNLSLNERTQLHAFAAKSGIAATDVENLLKQESSALLKQVVEDSLADGFFDDQESEHLSRIAIGLGLTLELTNEQQFRLSLARAAWMLLQQLRGGSLQQTLEFNGAEVFEVVSLKRPAGIPLGNDHYLKAVGAGTITRAEKSLLLDGRLVAKKYTLSSIADASWFSDGLFLKRSSGKSLFIRPLKFGLEWHKFAMAMEVLTTQEPVVGLLPDEPFIPAAENIISEATDEAAEEGDSAGDDNSYSDNWAPANRIPRFTFRVVGESFENRFEDLNKLMVGESVFLIREPANPYDSNAVAVINRQRRVLGYLKREVSLWFAPILDRGRTFKCEVKQRSSSGGVIIAVFE